MAIWLSLRWLSEKLFGSSLYTGKHNSTLALLIPFCSFSLDSSTYACMCTTIGSSPYLKLTYLPSSYKLVYDADSVIASFLQDLYTGSPYPCNIFPCLLFAQIYQSMMVWSIELLSFSGCFSSSSELLCFVVCQCIRGGKCVFLMMHCIANSSIKTLRRSKGHTFVSKRKCKKLFGRNNKHFWW